MSTETGNTNPHKSAKADAKAAQAYAKATRPWYKKKRYWALGFVLVLILAGVASGGGDEGDDVTATDDSSSSDTSDNGKKDKKPAAASEEEPAEEPAAKAMKVAAAALLKDFEGNEAAADAKYNGKTLEVSGVVSKVDTEFIDEEEYVVQINGGGDFEFLSVNCDDQSSDAVVNLSKGQDITVVGDFEDGGDLGVELDNCTIK